ncbi:MAG: carbohydrate ABC transporter permease, partial [Phyllobacterium sp.]
MTSSIKGSRPGLTATLPFIAPVYILVLGVIVLPSLFVLWLSFQSSSFGQSATFVGLANYSKI